MMNFDRWLKEDQLRKHKTNKKEIQELFEIVQRDLDDASVSGLSTDRRFLIAYEAALTLATIPLYCSGFETYGKGHHWLTFRLLPEVLGGEYSDMAHYFDQCRTKRNVGTYDRGGQITDSEVEELISEAKIFQEDIMDWIRQNHPELI